jgi:predicted nucleotidyltransferase
MNTLNQTYKDLAIPYFAEVFNHIDEVLKALQIPYYLIGVNSIAIQLLQEGIKPNRGTKDIDFAIMIESIKQFDEVVTSLEKSGFNKAKAPWTLFHPMYNVAIDLLPFGTIEEHDTVNFNKRYTDLHVLGFKEVLENTVPIQIEQKIANVPPLAGMIVLKFIAWFDRPEERTNDPADILTIIDEYYHIAEDKLYTEHFDLLANAAEPFDRRLIAAQLLGREIASIVNKSERVKERVMHVIDQALQFDTYTTSFLYVWAYERGWTLDYAHKLLNHLRLGIIEGLEN